MLNAIIATVKRELAILTVEFPSNSRADGPVMRTAASQFQTDASHRLFPSAALGTSQLHKVFANYCPKLQQFLDKGQHAMFPVRQQSCPVANESNKGR
jgi:hypothetical protein